MKKLIAQGGTILKESTFQEGPISVRFRKAALSTSGDLGEVEITGDGQFLRLTFKQALSLASQLISRCS